MMKSSSLRQLFITALCAMLLCVGQQMNAQTAFSLDSEVANQNTPEGWTAVDLPTGLPTFTSANTFDITTYGASTSSTDNTTAIQAALDAAAAAGGGMVVIPAGTFLTSYLQIGSKTVLHLSAGATLKMLAIDNYPKDANGYHKMENPLITGKSGASDIVIEGESRETSIIDGQGAPWWDQVETAKAKSQSTTRSALIRFWQGSRYLFRNFRIQNAPNTNIAIGKSGTGSHATAHAITIKNPASHDVSDPSHNTDGFPIWTQYVNIYDCEIDTGDDNVVTDSNAQFVHVWNCDMKAGHGASLGSYTVNMHDILYEDLTFTGTDCGFRLKSNRDRSGDVYNITFRNCTITNVMNPIQITAWYDTLPSTPENAAASPEELIETTPKFRDILIKDVTVTGYTGSTTNAKNGYGIFIYGRPESFVKDVTFDNVNITHSKGMKLNFCQGVNFLNCSFTNSQTSKSTSSVNVSELIEEQYECSYVWNGAQPVITKYAVAEGFTPTDNQVVAATTNVSLTYGADGSWKAAVAEGSVSGYSAYVSGNGNPKNNGAGYTTNNKTLPNSGTYYIFSPTVAGTIKAAIVLNSGKDFYVVKGSNGEALSPSDVQLSNNNGAVAYDTSNPYRVTAKLNGCCQFDVEAGETYYMFCTGSKLGFYGFEFTAATVVPAQTYTTVYDLAASMMAASSNFEGNSGSLAPKTAEAAANAPELVVDATSGKLGANNADWAQLNAGTVLTLPGVPEGATITFALYDNTALTINGTAYTNGQTYTTTKDENVVMTCTTGGYIKSITVEGTAFVTVAEPEGYTNTWQFGKKNGAEEFALQGSAEYEYTVNEHSLIINTDAGKLNNANRTDQWAQCNNGTKFKVPVYAGAKLTWGRYNGGSETGFKVNDQLYNEYYIATEDGTVELTAYGISYLSYIKVEPTTLYEISGTISGGDINGETVIMTAAGNGETYSAIVSENTFTMTVPADTYTPSLGGDVTYVVISPTSVTVSGAGSIGAITISAASAQTVTGAITNAPAEAFTLTFTGANHTETVNCAAGATSFSISLSPDTYVISSNVGTLSPLSVESFKVLTSAVNHNIYFPEAAVPAATQQNITVDNTLDAVSANNYKTITDALAAAKAGSISSPVITLTSGQTYREQVIVNQANVTFKTSDTEKATITWYYGIGYSYYSLNANGYYDKDRANTRNSKLGVGPARWGCTVLVNQYGNGFKAENIIFENSFNQYYTTEEVADGVEANQIGSSITYNRTLTPSDEGYKAADARTPTERAAAIAFENNPTGCQLYNCEFLSSQDTFFSSGKIYVKNCSIMGNTDYIFGGGNVVFDDCDLVIGGYSDQKASAYITANSASTGERYIFRDCTVKPSSRTYVSANLGRDWGGTNAHVYFFNLKNELGSDMSFTWNNMGGAVSAGTADLHIYDFNPTINTTYSTTGSSGANVNGVVSDADATTLYTGVVTDLGFTPEHIYDIPIDENSYYNNIRIKASDNGTGDITLTRTIKADKWNTIVLPFALTSDQIDAVFGDDVKVAQLTSFGDNTLHFTTVTEMNANEPYMIKVGTAFSNATINDVTIVESTPSKTDVNGIDFVGTYDAIINIPFSDASNTYYFISGNTLYSTASSGTANTMKGTRAYFQVPVSGGAKSLSYDFDNNGETTSIEQIVTPQFDNSEPMYNLAGQRVGTNYKGVIIQNGKKIVVK